MVEHRLNEYFLGSHLKSENERVEYHNIRSIDVANMNCIFDALKRLGDFDSYCSLYEMCEKNYQSVISCHSAIKDVFPSNRNRKYEYIDECSQEITRLLLNYLSSFITFYSHLYTKYKRLKRKGYDFFKDYERITSACYDGSFPYRFFYKFRNYAQHCGLPPIEMLIHEQLTQDGNVDIYVSISLLRDSLLRSYEEWGEKVKADLQNQPEHIELIPYLNVFQSQIELINHSVAGFEIPHTANSWQIIWEIVDEAYLQYPNAVPFIGQYKNRDSGQPNFSIIYFPIHRMLKFEGKSHISSNPEYSNVKSILSKIKSNSENYVAINDYVDIRQINK